jgi:hypothetical protein
MIPLLFALASFAQGPAAAPGVSVELSVRAALPNADSKIVKTFLVRDVRTPTVLYVYAPKTLCEGIIVTPDKPASATYGWSLEITPAAAGADIRWNRLWYGGSATRSALGSRQLRVGGSSYLSRGVLDMVDGGSRNEIWLKLNTLRNLDPASAEADRLPELSSDPALITLRGHMQNLGRELAEARGRLGEKHPTIVRLQSELALANDQARGRKEMILAGLISQYERATVPFAPVDGCAALSATVEAGLVRSETADVFEAELWFVHKAPDGKETSQRQTVRMRDGGRGDFYFDDMTLTLKNALQTLSIAVEVFGRIDVRTMPDNTTFMALDLTRRYIPKNDIAFGKWPKTGKTAYPITVTPGEVVSFLLPPLEDDNGILLGHRFSVRVRIKALDEL